MEALTDVLTPSVSPRHSLAVFLSGGPELTAIVCWIGFGCEKPSAKLGMWDFSHKAMYNIDHNEQRGRSVHRSRGHAQPRRTLQ